MSRAPSIPPSPAPAWFSPVDELIAAVEALQLRLGLGNEAFVDRYSWALSSVDVWQRTLRNRDPRRLTAANAPKWTARLQRLLDEADGAAEGEAVYPLPIVGEAVQLYDRLAVATGDLRVAWLAGTTGSGKTVALRHLLKTHPGQCAYVLVAPTWRERPGAIVRGLCAAVGIALERGTSTDAALTRLTSRLSARPLTLLIDEVHAGGVELVRVLKVLIDRCRLTRMLLTTWPAGFRKLVREYDRSIETAQLVGRSLRPFCQDWKQGPRREDIATYLRYACEDLVQAEQVQAADYMCAVAERWGLRVVAQAVALARQLASRPAPAGDDAQATAAGEPFSVTLRTAFDAVKHDVVDLSPSLTRKGDTQ